MILDNGYSEKKNTERQTPDKIKDFWLIGLFMPFVISNRIAAVGPVKLSDYVTHDNPPGINGWLVEGRIRFDAFVLNNKANAIYVHRSA